MEDADIPLINLSYKYTAHALTHTCSSFFALWLVAAKDILSFIPQWLPKNTCIKMIVATDAPEDLEYLVWMSQTAIVLDPYKCPYSNYPDLGTAEEAKS